MEGVGEVGGGACEYGAGAGGCRKILYAGSVSAPGEEARRDDQSWKEIELQQGSKPNKPSYGVADGLMVIAWLQEVTRSWGLLVIY